MNIGENLNPIEIRCNQRTLRLRLYVTLDLTVIKNYEGHLRFFLCSTRPPACFAEHFANQLSPRRTVTSLVWTSLPGMKARGPKGTYQSNNRKGRQLKIIYGEKFHLWAALPSCRGRGGK